MLVIEHTKRLGVPLLGPLDEMGLARIGAGLLPWLRQIAFSGRTDWDAA